MYFVQLRIAPQNPKTPQLIFNYFRSAMRHKAFSALCFLVGGFHEAHFFRS